MTCYVVHYVVNIWTFSIAYNVLIAMATVINRKGYLVFALTFQMNDRKDSSKFAHHPILETGQR